MSTIKLNTKLVKPHFTIVMKQEQKNIIYHVLDTLKDVDISGLSIDPDFLKYLSELIENQVTSVSDTSAKPGKIDILSEVLKRLYPNISDSDLATSINIVEYLLKNNLVKKVSISKIMKFYLKKKFSMV